MRRTLPRILSAFAFALAGCGTDGGGGSADPGGNTIASPAANVAPIVVDLGAAGSQGTPVGYVNGAFITVTVCVPGTSNCQDIDHVLVDTGSSGLRVLANDGRAGGKLNLPLPQMQNSARNAIAECAQFLDGFTWGPVQLADVKLSGETASNIPIQVISQTTYGVPSACESVGVDESTLEGDTGLYTNGILGVGLFRQDCGDACTVNPFLPASGNPGLYYACASSGSCSVAAVDLASQVSNPVASFPTDNNGVIVELPSVASSSGAATLNGSLVFGIGTKANNGLGSARVFAVDGQGRLITVYPASNGSSYPTSFIDSGSNGLFFLSTSITGIPQCQQMAGFYCPATTMNLSALNEGATGSPTGQVNFSVANGNTLLSGNNAALSNLAGPNPGVSNQGSFDWGLPFFYGRNVFTALENASTPGGQGPYLAY